MTGIEIARAGSKPFYLVLVPWGEGYLSSVGVR